MLRSLWAVFNLVLFVLLCENLKVYSGYFIFSLAKLSNKTSEFSKHKHGVVKEGAKFEDYFEIFIVKAYRKPITRVVEEGVFIINHEGQILN